MGAPIGWIAIRGMDRDHILEVVGLSSAMPGKRLAGTIWSLPTGWTFVLTFDFGFPTPERMAALSANGTAIALSADDRSMFSVVRGYEGGQAVFAIEHDGGEIGVRHIAAAGALPSEWPVILARLTQEQDEADREATEVDFLFDAPIELADALCGFRYDRPWPKGEEPNETPLMQTKGPGLLGRLFGR